MFINNVLSKKNVHDNGTDWTHIYDTYSPLMYGTILKMTGDEEMSEKIFVNVFLDVYRNKMLRPTHTDLCLSLLRHTFKVTLKHLKEQGLSVQKQFNAHYPLINLFYFEQATIKEAAKKTERTKEEILHGLREEFNHFCNNCT